MDSIDQIRTFVAVAEAGSFTGAARAMRMTPQLASKSVRQLEDRLGVQLLYRTTRTVGLTPAGDGYLDRARSLIEQFDAMNAMAHEAQAALSGRIRLTAPTGYGSLVVAPALAAFQDRHPGIDIELTLTDRRVSLIEEGLDLAVRVGQMQDTSLIQRKLVDMPVVVCASPVYLARHGEPDTPGALKSHNCLVNFALVDPGVWRFVEAGRTVSIKVSGNIRINQPRALADMAREGRGIAALPAYTVREDLAAGRVVEILHEFAPPPVGVYALYPSRQFTPPRIRAFVDHLADCARQ